MDYNVFLELAKSSLQERVYVGESTFQTYKEYVESFKSDRSDIIDKYGITESELFVMFMMLIKNESDIQEQFYSGGKSNLFTKECASLFDSFLNKMPRTTSSILYGVIKHLRIDSFIMKSVYDCAHYLLVSKYQSIINPNQNGVNLIINKRLIGESRAHDLFELYDPKDEKLICYERNTRFQIDNIDKDNKTVLLTEL